MADQPSSSTPASSTVDGPMLAHSAPATGPDTKDANGEIANATPVTKLVAPIARNSLGRKAVGTVTVHIIHTHTHISHIHTSVIYTRTHPHLHLHLHLHLHTHTKIYIHVCRYEPVKVKKMMDVKRTVTACIRHIHIIHTDAPTHAHAQSHTQTHTDAHTHTHAHILDVNINTRM